MMKKISIDKESKIDRFRGRFVVAIDFNQKEEKKKNERKDL